MENLILVATFSIFFCKTGIYAQQPKSPITAISNRASTNIYQGDQTGIINHAFRSGNLLISVKFRAGWETVAGLDVRFENLSDGFQEFHLEDLLVVMEDGSQRPLTVTVPKGLSNAIEIQPTFIAPKAFLFKQYGVIGKLNPPFKIYYKNELIAEIVKNN